MNRSEDWNATNTKIAFLIKIIFAVVMYLWMWATTKKIRMPTLISGLVNRKQNWLRKLCTIDSGNPAYATRCRRPSRSRSTWRWPADCPRATDAAYECCGRRLRWFPCCRWRPAWSTCSFWPPWARTAYAPWTCTPRMTNRGWWRRSMPPCICCRMWAGHESTRTSCEPRWAAPSNKHTSIVKRTKFLNLYGLHSIDTSLSCKRLWAR